MALAPAQPRQTAPRARDRARRWPDTRGVATVGRARGLVRALGGRFSKESLLDALTTVAAPAHLDVRDLEAALVRLSLYDFTDCPGGEECPLAVFDREELERF